ncbi:MAG: arginine--tRNA ligase [Candidatus Babeliales bacterium]
MNSIVTFKKSFLSFIQQLFGLSAEQIASIDVTLNADKDAATFGDLSCNAAMVLARVLGKNPRQLATEIIQAVGADTELCTVIEKIEIAGPGFLNITLTKQTWQQLARELLTTKRDVFTGVDNPKRYLLEFVSANPTGPLHLGHGRNGIIGDVMGRVLKFLGHQVATEFYINDAGSQMGLLGLSLQVRCKQQLGIEAGLPEEGYRGEYMVELAQQCVAEHGKTVLEKELSFFTDYAMQHLLTLQQKDLANYGIHFDQWFSEKTLHQSGQVEATIKILQERDLVYEEGGALWFKSTQFGDDKDRVIRKATGELTYIAADIAYHKNKFDRGYDVLIDILGQDHHGYVKRLKATMQALGYNADALDVILYQLVTIKENDVAVRMSKRAGTFTKLSDVVDEVGTDVARFFYLHRKADTHLEFDLATALKKTDENPVFYIHYAYVRALSVLAKAQQEVALKQVVDSLPLVVSLSNHASAQILRQAQDERTVEGEEILALLSPNDIALLKKILSLRDILSSIERTYQTNILANYAWELAHSFHSYYAGNRVIDPENVEVSKMRLLMVVMAKDALEVCLDLLGLTKPERM